MTVATRDTHYEVDGRRFAGFIADGSQGRRAPGVLVVHEGRGFTQHPRDRALMLANLGYVAFAPDFFGEPASSLEHAYALMQPFQADPERLVAHSLSALEFLARCPGVDSRRLGAIGFCWGGYVALELACQADLKCAVGFHPGLSLGRLSRPDQISANVMICVGDQDPYVPLADIAVFMRDMAAAGVDAQILLLPGAPHSFSNPEPYAYEIGEENVGYDPRADRRAWSAMRELLHQTFEA